MAGWQVRENSSSISISYQAQGNSYNTLAPGEFRTATYSNSQLCVMYRVKNFSNNGYMPASNIKVLFTGNGFGYRNTGSIFETSNEVGGYTQGGYTSASWLYKVHLYGVKG